MKQKILATLLVLILGVCVLGLVACGEESTDVEPDLIVNPIDLAPKRGGNPTPEIEPEEEEEMKETFDIDNIDFSKYETVIEKDEVLPPENVQALCENQGYEVNPKLVIFNIYTDNVDWQLVYVELTDGTKYAILATETGTQLYAKMNGKQVEVLHITFIHEDSVFAEYTPATTINTITALFTTHVYLIHSLATFTIDEVA